MSEIKKKYKTKVSQKTPVLKKKDIKKGTSSAYYGLFLMDETTRNSPGVSYYFWYLKFLQLLIKYNLAECKWLDFHDEIIPIIEDTQHRLFSEDTMKERFSVFKSNPFLMEYKHDPILLAKDILENGMYVPFLLKKSDEGRIVFCNGAHRLNSMAMYSNTIEPIHKKYPCLIFPEKEVFEQSYLLPWIYEGFAFYVPINNRDHLIQLFDLNGGEVTKNLRLYNKNIQKYPFLANLDPILPSPAINDEEEWKRLLSKELANEDFNRLLKHYADIGIESLLTLTSDEKYVSRDGPTSFHQEFYHIMKKRPEFDIYTGNLIEDNKKMGIDK